MTQMDQKGPFRSSSLIGQKLFMIQNPELNLPWSRSGLKKRQLQWVNECFSSKMTLDLSEWEFE